MANIIILIYLIAVTAIGIYSRFLIKSPDDYYIAGKKGSWLMVSGSLLATILGSSAILGTLELSQKTGWAAVWFLLCASAGLFILAPIARYVSRYGTYTLPGLLEHFYGKKARQIASFIIPVAWLGVIAAQIIGAAKILGSIGLMSYQTGAIVSTGVFIVYTLIGGQKSVLRTDLFQTILIFAGLAILFFTVQGKPATTPIEPPPGLFNEQFSWVNLLILFLTYSTTFVVGPDIYSRIFCAKSEKTAIVSVLITAALLVPFAIMLTWLGLSATPTGASGGSISIVVLGQEILPPWAFGLLIAALLSAVMSSGSSTLLTSSMILSEWWHGSISHKNAFNTTRFFLVVMGLLSLALSLYVTSIIDSLLLALSFFSGAFIVPTLAGLLKMKVNRNHIMAAIITGGLMALSGKVLSVYVNGMVGNAIIIFSFLINGILLFLPGVKKNHR